MALIVSLTSTRSRLSILRYTLMSLLEQSEKADAIFLNISKRPYLFDEGIEQLPEWLAELDGAALNVNWVENTGPYRKLLPVLSTVADTDMIVTCDDDVIYGRDWLKYLLAAKQRYPDAVVCGRARIPVTNLFGRRQSYLHWPLAPANHQGDDLLPIGVAGVLYGKQQLAKAIIESEDYLSLAPKQDDLWFNLATRMSGAGVVVAEGAGAEVFEIKTPENLSSTNASTQSKRAWDRFCVTMVDRFIARIKGYLGVSICDNDVVLSKLNKLL